MSELEKILRNIVLGGVGAVATAVEKTGEVAKNLVAKGSEVVSQAAPTREALEREIDGVREQLREELKTEDLSSKEARERVRAAFEQLDGLEQCLARRDEAQQPEAEEEPEAEAKPDDRIVDAVDRFNAKTAEADKKPQPAEAPQEDRLEQMLESLFGKAPETKLPEGLENQLRDGIKQVGDLFRKAGEILRGPDSGDDGGNG
ncbi:MAG: hypothetical protein IKH38_04105 [Clostridia bacterium]|nr:hypothetical protein [Clostridia bacterium]